MRQEPEPCDPGNGHPFVFISYSHRDSRVVYDVLTGLPTVRFWFDRGIRTGVEWPEEIADALINCHQFVVFLSPSAVESDNVRHEINFALHHAKPILPVYVEHAELTPGLEMRLGATQAVKATEDIESTIKQVRLALRQEVHLDFAESVSVYESLKKCYPYKHIVKSRYRTLEITSILKGIAFPEVIDRISRLRADDISATINFIIESQLSTYFHTFPDMVFDNWDIRLSRRLLDHLHSAENSPISFIRNLIGFNIEVSDIRLQANQQRLQGVDLNT